MACPCMAIAAKAGSSGARSLAISIFFSASSPDLGAQQLQLLRQAQGLQAAGWKPRILCRPGSRLAEEAAKRGLRVEREAFAGAPLPLQSRIPTLARLAPAAVARKPELFALQIVLVAAQRRPAP